MKLRLANFQVGTLDFGNRTEFRDGILTINKEEALSIVLEDQHITEAELYIVNPGDPVRLLPVKDAIEPRYRVGGGPVFPGVTGPLLQAGAGQTKALKGMSVVVVGKHYGGFQDGLIDMAGEGAKFSYFSQLKNLVLVAHTDEDFEYFEQQKRNRALRWAGFRLAEYVGAVTKNLAPDYEEVFEFEALVKLDSKFDDLPSLALVLQPQSQMEEMGYNTLLYGWDCNHILPTLMNPNEVLDGALVSGSFMPSSSKWSTYDFQNFPMIRSLLNENGKSLNFLGVIMSNLNVALEQKERAAQFVAQIAGSLGADSAIVVEEGYGNPDVDFIACIVSLEKAGVKTVGLTNECTGRDGASQPLVSMDERADAIVSCGNVSTLIELPAMEIVLGDLESLARDGLSGGWSKDDSLGPSVRPDGSIILENNAMFCGDQVVGWSVKTVAEY